MPQSPGAKPGGPLNLSRLKAQPLSNLQRSKGEAFPIDGIGLRASSQAQYGLRALKGFYDSRTQ